MHDDIENRSILFYYNFLFGTSSGWAQSLEHSIPNRGGGGGGGVKFLHKRRILLTFLFHFKLKAVITTICTYDTIVADTRKYQIVRNKGRVGCQNLPEDKKDRPKCV